MCLVFDQPAGFSGRVLEWVGISFAELSCSDTLACGSVQLGGVWRTPARSEDPVPADGPRV